MTLVLHFHLLVFSFVFSFPPYVCPLIDLALVVSCVFLFSLFISHLLCFLNFSFYNFPVLSCFLLPSLILSVCIFLSLLLIMVVWTFIWFWCSVCRGVFLHVVLAGAFGMGVSCYHIKCFSQIQKNIPLVELKSSIRGCKKFWIKDGRKLWLESSFLGLVDLSLWFVGWFEGIGISLLGTCR